ncbi:DNA-directed RNA polymerase subunit A'/A'', partial [Candidatus Bathyarchaeota archaeon]
MEESYGKIIEAIRFGIISPQEIRKLSVVEIQTADTYDEDGAVIPSGLMDNRLGVLEPGQRCRTCGNTATRCPGHFGHIELAVPIIHVEFTKNIHDLLQAFCRNCGRILLNERSIIKAKKQSERIKSLLGDIPDTLYRSFLDQAKSAMQCPHC